LQELRAGQLIATALFDWLIIAVCWLVLSGNHYLLVEICAIVVIAGRFVALGSVLHDACHRRLGCEKTFRWWLVEGLAGWPISSTTAAMRYHHLRHHRWVGTALDPYRSPSIFGSKLKQPWLTLRGLLLPIAWTLRPIVGICSLIFPSLKLTYAKVFLHFIVLIVVLVYSLPFVTHVLIPLLIAGMLNAYRLSVEHKDSEEIKGSVKISDHTVSHQAGWLARLIIYPHNLGCHVAHHKHPTVAYSHLPEIEARLSLHDNYS